jgi:FixJ family two-component response regulator
LQHPQQTEVPEIGTKVTEATLISIVDDDDDAREGLADLVQSLGYITAEFATAEQFLRADVVGKTACLISDVQMPGMSGLDLLEQLIATGQPKPVILVTAFSNEKMRARALASGAVGFHAKPVATDTLIESIGRALASVS